MKTGVKFLSISETVVWLAGHGLVLAGAAALVLAWCAMGFALGLPKEWHLLSTMFGTLVTLFLLLIMQHSQNRDMAALQVKVDELIRSSAAGNHMIGVERLEAEELERLAENQTT
jgi:low affinity Fe/Cu permease